VEERYGDTRIGGVPARAVVTLLARSWRCPRGRGAVRAYEIGGFLVF